MKTPIILLYILLTMTFLSLSKQVSGQCTIPTKPACTTTAMPGNNSDIANNQVLCISSDETFNGSSSIFGTIIIETGNDVTMTGGANVNFNTATIFIETGASLTVAGNSGFNTGATPTRIYIENGGTLDIDKNSLNLNSVEIYNHGTFSTKHNTTLTIQDNSSVCNMGLMDVNTLNLTSSSSSIVNHGDILINTLAINTSAVGVIQAGSSSTFHADLLETNNQSNALEPIDPVSLPQPCFSFGNIQNINNSLDPDGDVGVCVQADIDSGMESNLGPNGSDQCSGCVVALPVEWGEIEAVAEGFHVIFTWETISEENSDKFIVQRTKDGITFEDMTDVSASGNSGTLKEYSYLDTAPIHGESYYRLKEIDIDGKEQYSKLFPIDFDAPEHVNLTLYPNPVTTHFSLHSDGDLSNAEVIVETSNGQIVSPRRTHTQDNQIDFNTTRLSQGIYFVHIIIDGFAYTKEFVVVH